MQSMRRVYNQLQPCFFNYHCFCYMWLQLYRLRNRNAKTWQRRRNQHVQPAGHMWVVWVHSSSPEKKEQNIVAWHARLMMFDVRFVTCPGPSIQHCFPFLSDFFMIHFASQSGAAFFQYGLKGMTPPQPATAREFPCNGGCFRWCSIVFLFGFWRHNHWRRQRCKQWPKTFQNTWRLTCFCEENKNMAVSFFDVPPF